MKVTITPQSATLTPETPEEFSLMRYWLRGANPITMTPCEMMDHDKTQALTLILPPVVMQGAIDLLHKNEAAKSPVYDGFAGKQFFVNDISDSDKEQYRKIHEQWAISASAGKGLLPINITSVPPDYPEPKNTDL